MTDTGSRIRVSEDGVIYEVAEVEQWPGAWPHCTLVTQREVGRLEVSL